MKLVKESLIEESLINESYESLKELSVISKFIMKNKEKLKKPYTLKSIFKNQKLSDFPLTKIFLNSDIKIIFYSGMRSPMFAYPLYSKEDLEKYPFLHNKDKAGIIIINNQEDALLHELQHAFDYFRSGGKMAIGKKINMYKKMGGSENLDTDKTQLIRYYRLKPEQSSYFTEVVNILKEKYYGSKKENIENIKYIYDQFKFVYPDWEILPEKDKKNLTRKFFQYWQKFIEEK